MAGGSLADDSRPRVSAEPTILASFTPPTACLLRTRCARPERGAGCVQSITVLSESLDDPRRLQQHQRRNREPKSFGGPEIDHELEGSGLLHRQVARVGGLQDLVDIDRGPSKVVRHARTIRCEGTGVGKAELEHSRKPMP